MPLSDWRDGFEHADAAECWPAIYDRAYLLGNIAGGEGFDWFYASAADRSTQVRAPFAEPLRGAGNSFSEDPMTTTFHRHWRDVPESTWRWPNFSPAEIACRGTGKLLVNEPALDKLQAMRDRPGKPLSVRSAYRSPEHNRAVGGATRSKHRDGAAFDIAVANRDPVAFEAEAREVGFLGFGFYPRSGIHPYRPRARTAVGRAVPGPGDGLCSRDAARTRSAGREPHHEGRRGGGSCDAGAQPGSRWPSRCWRKRKAPSFRSCRISIRSAGCSSRRRSAGSR